jgi:2-polyprenyl-3-methyl-5-hydroxy-6-metoxy-1,4-benzoquinol methylase
VPGEPEGDRSGEELAALIGEIRQRVRAGYPDRASGGEKLPDLLPLLHARDAALAKVAAIGSVNPRAPGPLNGAIQLVKRTVSRLLDWHVRGQVEFNREVLAALDAALEALSEGNRQLADLRAHWAEWHAGWEQRLASTENELLRTIAELKLAFDFRLGQTSEEIQRRILGDLAILRGDFERVRGDYERLIHAELRLIRQRSALQAALVPGSAPAPLPAPVPSLDYASFAERFRGTEEYVRERQRFYLPFFAGRHDVLDLGCGRGEFLELMREAGVLAHGLELSAELVAICRAKGLNVELGDLLSRLPEVPDESLDGIFCAHVVEHLPPERLPGMIRAAAAKLRPEGVLAIETPNPACLAALAIHFYLDPTHVRPVPAGLLRFYLEESGLGRIEVHPLSPAVEGEPALASLPADFREAFFGGLDYAIIGRKL